MGLSDLSSSRDVARESRGFGPRSPARPYRGSMRWDDLFADLEAQLDAADAAALGAQVSELTRAERASITLVDRLRGSQGARVDVHLAHADRTGGADVVRGVVVDVAEQWVLLEDGPWQHLVPLVGVAHAGGLRPRASPGGGVLRRLGLGHALRALARDRVAVRVDTTGGLVVGRIEVVGSDYVEMTSLPAGEAGVGRLGPARLVPFPAVRLVSSG